MNDSLGLVTILKRLRAATLAPQLGIASRAVAATAGGWLVSAIATALLAVSLPLARQDAVMAATTLSFAIYACAVLWTFIARTALRAWIGLVCPALLMSCALALVRGTHP